LGHEIAATLAVLIGEEHLDVRVSAVAGTEERDSLYVVPVQVREQDRSMERFAVK
jgi:hypothetical protein